MDGGRGPWWQEAIEGMTMSSTCERDSGFSEEAAEEEEAEGEEFRSLAGLSLDLRFLAGMPELCDVLFLVGEEREPVFGVKAVLAIRSRVFYKLLFGPKSRGRSTPPGGGGNGAVSKRIQKMFTDNSPIIMRNSRRASLSQGSNAAGEKQTVIIDEFEPDVFKELLDFIHTGRVLLHPRTLLGLMNAADHFAIEDLRRACVDYSGNVIKLDTVCSLLVTAERYIQYKSTKIFIQRVLEFVDRHGEEVLQQGELVHLPRHVLELILTREDLVAAETTKWRAVERWARHFLLYHPREHLSGLMRPFVQYIAFQHIPTAILMQEIQPLHIVPDDVLMQALASQADPGFPTPRTRHSMSPRFAQHLRKSAAPIRSLDRNTSKRSTGSSGYNSLVYAEERCASREDGKTILHIDDDPPPPRGSASISDLTYRTVSPLEYTRM